MIKIEVTDKVTEKSGISSKTQRPYSIREQQAFAHVYEKDGTLARYPKEIKLSLRDDTPPFAPGDYTIAPASVFIGEFGRMELNPVLVPVKAPVRAAA